MCNPCYSSVSVSCSRPVPVTSLTLFIVACVAFTSRTTRSWYSSWPSRADIQDVLNEDIRRVQSLETSPAAVHDPGALIWITVRSDQCDTEAIVDANQPVQQALELCMHLLSAATCMQLFIMGSEIEEGTFEVNLSRCDESHCDLVVTQQ